jgi:hypothetical protein
VADADITDRELALPLGPAVRSATAEVTRAPSESPALNNGQRESRTMVLSHGAVLDCVELSGIPHPPEWQRIGNQINAAFVFARADFVNVLTHAFSSMVFANYKTRSSTG